ncbi:MAG: beta-N-acetylhexosaminidase [Bacilli bacterium]|nr:beta-N-acetylhexosaminidase [Bacilli bacterium]
MKKKSLLISIIAVILVIVLTSSLTIQFAKSHIKNNETKYNYSTDIIKDETPEIPNKSDTEDKPKNENNNNETTNEQPNTTTKPSNNTTNNNTTPSTNNGTTNTSKPSNTNQNNNSSNNSTSNNNQTNNTGQNNSSTNNNTSNNNQSTTKPSNNTSNNQNSNTSKPNTSSSNTTSNNNSNQTTNIKINSLNDIDTFIKNMTLEEKIGQMLIIEYRKSKMDSTLENMLKTVKPGGFILFKENFVNYSQAKNLINSIKSKSSIPMFLSIDQEGGRVQRIKNLSGASITTIPPMSEIGATNNTDKAYQIGATIAKDLKLFNINMDFAPVIDVNYNPLNSVIGNRSFGSDPHLVSKMGQALSKGLNDNGIISVFKHFPGHGSTEADSHYILPVLTKTKEKLLNSDLIPFVDAIKNNAEVIMIGHLAVPNITGDSTPASLSKKLITNFLKEELGYSNLVITDALNMKAITNNYSQKQIYELAINAGVDILLIPSNPQNAINSIKSSIKNGTISEQQINSSVKKILTLKYKYKII